MGAARRGEAAHIVKARSYMNAAFPKFYFDRLGLVSLLDTPRRLQCLS